MSSKNSKLKNNPKPLFLKPKGVKVVTKKVLLRIANNIYNPKTKEYLNLCRGKLQAGTDPVCESRQMHCGLGELYFVVTGRQPYEDGVNEIEVVDVVVKRSNIMEQITQDVKKLDKLVLPPAMNTVLRAALIQNSHIYVTQLRYLLSTIPDENDRGDGAVMAEKTRWPERAKRVAKVLREAAELLPR